MIITQVTHNTHDVHLYYVIGLYLTFTKSSLVNVFTYMILIYGIRYLKLHFSLLINFKTVTTYNPR